MNNIIISKLVRIAYELVKLNNNLRDELRRYAQLSNQLLLFIFNRETLRQEINDIQNKRRKLMSESRAIIESNAEFVLKDAMCTHLLGIIDIVNNEMMDAV